MRVYEGLEFRAVGFGVKGLWFRAHGLGLRA